MDLPRHLRKEKKRFERRELNTTDRMGFSFLSFFPFAFIFYFYSLIFVGKKYVVEKGWYQG